MNVISLFSGCGGLDLGFIGGFKCLKKSINLNMHKDWINTSYNNWVLLNKTGFDIKFSNDILKEAKLAWTNYHSKNDVYLTDSIVDLVNKEKLGNKIFPKDIDIVLGGFPCQDFSVAGNRLGFNSTKSHNGTKTSKPTMENRGQLYMWMRDVINLVKPKVFIAENVKGLSNLHDSQKIIENDFRNANNKGYIVVAPQILNAKYYGVPQNRERIIFIGFRKDLLNEKALKALTKDKIIDKYNPYPQKTHETKFVTCKDAFIDLEEPELSTDLSQSSYSKAKFLNNKGQGQTEIKLNDVAPTIRAEHHGNIEFRRLSKEHGGKHIQELNKGLKERRLTIRECARLQTFPDDYNFVFSNEDGSLSASTSYKLIGNAVPCLLGYNLAMNLKNKWDLYFN